MSANNQETEQEMDKVKPESRRQVKLYLPLFAPEIAVGALDKSLRRIFGHKISDRRFFLHIA